MGADATSLVKLNLGCGDKLVPGYVNVDMAVNHSGKKPDVEADLRKLPFDDDYADEILSVHVFEHFYVWEASDVLKEWARVLKPGGKIILEMPSLGKIIGLAIQPEIQGDVQKLATFVWGGLYGDQRYKSVAMQHKWCYTPEQVISLFNDTGIKGGRELPAQYHWPQRDMRIEGYK